MNNYLYKMVVKWSPVAFLLGAGAIWISRTTIVQRFIDLMTTHQSIEGFVVVVAILIFVLLIVLGLLVVFGRP